MNRQSDDQRYQETAKPKAEFLSALLCGLGAAVLWGLWPVLSRYGIEQTLSTMDIVALRFAVAGIILLPLLWRLGLSIHDWKSIVLLSAGAGAPYVLFAIGGLNFASAGHAGVIIPSCMMTFSTIGSWWWLSDKPNRARLIGIGIIIMGVVLIGWESFQAKGEHTWIGDLMFVAAGLLWATFTVSSGYYRMNPWHATAIVSVVSMVLFTPVYFILTPTKFSQIPIGELVFQGVFQGVFVAIGALWLYTKSVQLLGAGKAAIFATLVPGFAVLLAFPILDEIPSTIELIGVIGVMFGMLYALGLIKSEK